YLALRDRQGPQRVPGFGRMNPAGACIQGWVMNRKPRRYLICHWLLLFGFGDGPPSRFAFTDVRNYGDTCTFNEMPPDDGPRALRSCRVEEGRDGLRLGQSLEPAFDYRRYACNSPILALLAV